MVREVWILEFNPTPLHYLAVIAIAAVVCFALAWLADKRAK